MTHWRKPHSPAGLMATNRPAQLARAEKSSSLFFESCGGVEGHADCKAPRRAFDATVQDGCLRADRELGVGIESGPQAFFSLRSSHERSWFGAIYALLGVLSIALVFVGALYLFEVP